MDGGAIVISSTQGPLPARSRAWTHVLPVLAGLLAGVGSSALLARRAPAAQAAARTPSHVDEAAARAEPRAAAPPLASARLAALEQKVATLAASSEPAEPAPPEAREEARARARQTYDDAIRRHGDAPVDPAWAAPAGASLGAAMRAIAARPGGQGEVKGVECHTDSCLATLEFPSFADAVRGQGTYVSSFYEVNCMRMTMLDPTDDPAAPYTVRVIFKDCKKD
jgi:hypothetical protein